jgi:hypothetical protein
MYTVACSDEFGLHLTDFGAFFHSKMPGEAYPGDDHHERARRRLFATCRSCAELFPFSLLASAASVLAASDVCHSVVQRLRLTVVCLSSNGERFRTPCETG